MTKNNETKTDFLTPEEQNQLNINLLKAAKENNVEGVLALLEAGADINFADELGQTALIFATCDGNKEIVQALLDAGAV